MAAETTVTGHSGNSGPGFWDRLAQIPPASQTHPRWHISPVVDMAAYHFSWAFLLIPALFFGPSQHRDYLYLFCVVMGFNLAHRHYGLPYAYLDRNVFAMFRQKLLWFPLICLGLLLATPFLVKPSIGGSLGRSFVGAVVFFSVLWNFWHVFMQKFGIMRIYMAKDPSPLERKTPPWVDKLMLFCWLPLFFAYLGPTYKNLVYKNGASVRPYTSKIIQFMETHESLILAPSILLVVAGLGIWCWYEWRAHQFRNPARLAAGLGNTMLLACFLWLDPVKVYIAFGFSHAVEYMVFVWAFQRRRYADPAPHPTLMERILQRPVLWYVGFTVIFGAVGFLAEMGNVRSALGLSSTYFLGFSIQRWVFYYAVYESLIHFYMDGFLWKIRRAEVRASI